jgi:hypothetical protein
MRIRERHQRCRLDLVQRRGHEYLSLENELIRVTFVLTKGADLLEFRHKPSDIDAMWHSPHRLNPPGTQIDTIAASGGAFLDYYAGGWQELLPAGSSACTYMGAEFGLHGESALLPWEAEVVEDTPERVAVRLTCELRRTPFVVERTVSVEEGRLGIVWAGRVTNTGHQDLAYMWGQHAAFGAPFIEAGCQIDLPPATVTTWPAPYSRGMRYAAGQTSPWPNLKTVDGGVGRADLVPGMEARTHDTYTITPEASWYAIRNPRRDLGFAMRWDQAVYPHLWAWQVYGGMWDAPYYGRIYVLALEPFSSPAGTLLQNIERGTVHTLAAGASIEMELRAGFFPGAQTPVRGVDQAGDVLR